MSGIIIHNPGLLTTIQDTGRTGYRQYGMPSSGAMDQLSLRCANWLVGNDLSEAVMEITVMGPDIEFLNSCRFAITGASFSPELNGVKIAEWTTIKAKKGDLLSFGNLRSGARAYLSISGGFRIEDKMGSKSTYLPSAIGGYNGRALKNGDIIPLFPTLPAKFKERKIPFDIIPRYFNNVSLSVLPGVDWNDFSDETKKSFFGTEYIVTSDSNRMGYRLDGPPVRSDVSNEVLSRAVHYGTIQIPGDGQPIIMGADCQTIGGYRQFVNVISAELNLLAQIMPGYRVSFKLVELTAAISDLRKSEDRFAAVFRKGSKIICTDCIVYKR
ncbi:MAG TPA: biotin-dependent carboxyltransferase family protein [Bacteroidales bacterium]|nr:biotin-dependent carboxyltransferase family protein [Bacteroidales bacterium]